MKWHHFVKSASISAVLTMNLIVPFTSFAQDNTYYPVDGQEIPNTGQTITPLAPNGSNFQFLNPGLADSPQYVAGQAVTTMLSPDKTLLFVLTSGYNLLNYTEGATAGQTNPNDSNEYVFIFDVSQKQPVQRQVIQVPNTYSGLAINPIFHEFYVTGGVDDDVHVFAQNANQLFSEVSTGPVKLGHLTGVGLGVKPAASGIAVSRNGLKMIVTNYYNDSVTVLTRASGAWEILGELDLRPGKINPAIAGTPGGEYPFWVVMKGNETAYVSSMRDREIDQIDVTGSPTLTARIKVKGQPNRMTLNASQGKLFVALDDSDAVGILDTTMGEVLGYIPVTGPESILPENLEKYKGNNTNSVTLSPDEKTLYVTNGNMNDVAVVKLNGSQSGGYVAGLIPTGWYPTSVSVSADGSYLYITNFKSPTGPNPGNCHGLTAASAALCVASNSYSLQLIKAGLESVPTPSSEELPALTKLVARNNHFHAKLDAADEATMEFLRHHIKHVIYIIKENRTYDQVLGDLPIGNGDPTLTEFGQAVTPNLHNIALNFVTFDNYFDRSEVSMDGWPWSVSAAAPDVVEKQTSVNYAGRGLSYDSEGTNRNVNIGYKTLQGRLAANPFTANDPDVLPGQVNTDAPDGPDGEQGTGYLWDQALRAKLTVRNYGFFIDLARYNPPKALAAYAIPKVLDPASAGIQVAFTSSPSLRPFTDPYFRGFDQGFPDYYRFKEWAREFDTKFANGGLPALNLVRLAHDHTGNFSTGILGLNTPELEVADNDYAVGLLVEKIARSPYKDDTLIFVTEDDAQDGGDHVEVHRSIGFVAGPYVKQGALVSTSYNTVNMVRTIEEVLGLKPMNLNDAIAKPMTDAFDMNQKVWQFYAQPSTYLLSTQVLPPEVLAKMKQPALHPSHDGAYWANATKGLDFSAEDLLEGKHYNQILWKGLMGGKPYPETSTGLDLRQNRQELLSHYQKAQNAAATQKRTPAAASSNGGQ